MSYLRKSDNGCRKSIIPTTKSSFRLTAKNTSDGTYPLLYFSLNLLSKSIHSSNDWTSRIVASARIDKYLDNVMPEYTFNQEVNLLVADETESFLT